MLSPRNDNTAKRPASLRIANAALVMDCLADGLAASRSELAARTSLSSQALGSILADLVEGGLVVEQMRETAAPGRPPTEYAIDRRGTFTVTVFVRLADYFVLIDDALQTRLATVRVRYRRVDEAAALIAPIAGEIVKTIEDCQLQIERLERVDFAIQGVIAEDRRVVATTPIWPESDVDVAGALTAALGATTVTATTIEAAQARHALNSVEHHPGELVSILHVGVDSRVLLAQGGQLITNRLGNGGLITHLPLRGNDQRCECGRDGCLGTMSGGPATVSHYRDISGHVVSTAAEVIDLIGEGDADAIEAARRSIEWLARGIAPILQMIHPDRLICTGGGVGRPQSAGADRLVTALREQLDPDLIDLPIDVVAPAFLVVGTPA